MFKSGLKVGDWWGLARRRGGGGLDHRQRPAAVSALPGRRRHRQRPAKGLPCLCKRGKGSGARLAKGGTIDGRHGANRAAKFTRIDRRGGGGACQLSPGGAAKGGRGKGVGRPAKRRHGVRAGQMPDGCTGKHSGKEKPRTGRGL